MLLTARRLFTGPLLAAAVVAGLVAAPAVAQAAAVTATVQVSSTLFIRTTPSLSGKVVGTLRDEQRIAVQCLTAGTNVRGSVRTSNQWARLGAAKYIAYAYLGAPGKIGRCGTVNPQAAPLKVRATKVVKPTIKYIIGTVRSTQGVVNMRTTPSTAGAVVLKLESGRRVALVCAVAGQSVSGTVRNTTQWDRTGSGNYVSHAFIVSPTLPVCAGSRPPVASPGMTPEQFIKAAVPGAQQGWREYGVPPSVTIAQAILESGWGKSALSSVHKNYFGIKCQNGKFGTLANGCYVYKTTECTKAGTCFSTTGAFRTYSSMANSFRDHGSFLRVNSRYAPAFNYTKDANRFIWNVWKAGYATDPNYFTKVTGIMAANKLYQYNTWK